MVNDEQVIVAHRVNLDLMAGDLDHAVWDEVHAVSIVRYWSGEAAPLDRHAQARLVWSDAALCVRFVCRQNEPLVVSDAPETTTKTLGLWDRDVCEIYVAPDASAPERYFEFEAAPTGEWLDLAIHHARGRRETDWEYASGMSAAARIEAEWIKISMRIPFTAFGRMPQIGERWRANLFRCIGRGEAHARGYLAWQPTYAAQPNFHVPQVFGWLEFGE